MCRGFFQRFQKCVKGAGAKHVYLVYDVHFIFSGLRREAHLVYDIPDIFYGIITGGIEFMYIERSTSVKADTTFTYITSLIILGKMRTINCFCEDPGTGCFTNATGSAKQKSMCQLLLPDGIFQGSGDVGLTHYG
jgi:hypothetical protein